MKKLFIVLVAIVLVASLANAQGITGYGPKLQLNLVNVSGDKMTIGNVSIENKMAVMFGFGGFLVYNVIPKLDLQAEVLYSQKGSKSEAFGLNWTGTNTYLEGNLLAKYLIQMKGDVTPCIFAGPSIGVLLDAILDQVPLGLPTYIKSDYKDDLESLDYGIIFGAGVSIKAGDGSVVVDVRYNLGLANILKTGGSVLSQQNQVISICVGYAYL
jgi:hypothetical protein